MRVKHTCGHVTSYSPNEHPPDDGRVAPADGPCWRCVSSGYEERLELARAAYDRCREALEAEHSAWLRAEARCMQMEREREKVEARRLTMTEPAVHGLLQGVFDEILASRKRFPGNAKMLPALMEEVGELSRAMLEGQGSERRRQEAVQVAAVALRIAIEGDNAFE